MFLEMVENFCAWGFSGIFNFLVWYVSGVIIACIITLLLNKLLLKPDEYGENFYQDLEIASLSYFAVIFMGAMLIITVCCLIFFGSLERMYKLVSKH